MIAIALLASATALTPQEAQTLPLSELSQHVLGAAGAVVVDVDRPRWPECYGLCPPSKPHPDGPPPLSSLTFYTRASAMSDVGYLGLCHATAIEVRFDNDGAVTSVNQLATIGWLGSLASEKSGSGPNGVAARSSQFAEFNDRCRALPTTRQFIRAAQPYDVSRALIAIALIHESMWQGGTIRVTCAFGIMLDRPCAKAADLRALAADVAVEKITGIDRVDPRTGRYLSGGPADSGCYTARLESTFHSADAIGVCVQVTAGKLNVTRAAFTRSTIVY